MRLRWPAGRIHDDPRLRADTGRLAAHRPRGAEPRAAARPDREDLGRRAVEAGRRACRRAGVPARLPDGRTHREGDRPVNGEPGHNDELFDPLISDEPIDLTAVRDDDALLD